MTATFQELSPLLRLHLCDRHCAQHAETLRQQWIFPSDGTCRFPVNGAQRSANPQALRQCPQNPLAWGTIRPAKTTFLEMIFVGNSHGNGPRSLLSSSRPTGRWRNEPEIPRHCPRSSFVPPPFPARFRKRRQSSASLGLLSLGLSTLGSCSVDLPAKERSIWG